MKKLEISYVQPGTMNLFCVTKRASEQYPKVLCGSCREVLNFLLTLLVYTKETFSIKFPCVFCQESYDD